MIPWQVGPGPYQPGLIPLSPGKVGRAALGMAAGVNQDQIIKRVCGDEAGPREHESSSLD